jgi:hypothetical protein
MVIDCPHCFTKVIPKPDGSCPACQGNTRVSRARPDYSACRVGHNAPLPPICCGCGQAADQYYAITSHSTEGRSEASGVTALLLAMISLPMAIFMLLRGMQETSVVQVKLPICPHCRQFGLPTPQYVDFKNARMTFVVHKRLKEALEPPTSTEWAIPLRE